MNPIDRANFSPFQRVGIEAFREALEADPTVSPQEFVPNDPHQAQEFWRAVQELQATPTATHPVQSGSTDAKEEFDRATRIPERIGHFHIKRLIATGGMGTVYQAMQENPRRMVAVKVMRPGLTSRSALRRFQYESQLLARLRHPGIAQVYEAGMHQDDFGEVPFFAMEYIANARSLTSFAAKRKYELREKLRLFVEVCDAVHHGHQKGIIHRDLKPENILVDARGQVKIIDFGVAKCTDSDLAMTTLQTDYGQLVGTIQYMSPEQCEADPQDIDIRSDVYSLGVVLYALLCGRLPYEISQKAIHDATRIIREQPPEKIGAIDSSLRGDLESIVLRALEKDRDRRYQSALELASEITRFLAGEAIYARPPSFMYQLRALTRRNRRLVSGGVLVIAFFLMGVILFGVLYLSANEKRRAAEASLERMVDLLPALMESKLTLGSNSSKELQDAKVLIQKYRLDSTFADRLNPTIREQFLDLLNKTATETALQDSP